MRLLLTVLAALLYAIGWVAGILWAGLSWGAAAVRVGFTDAASPRALGAPQRQPEKVAVPAYPAPPARAA